MCIDEELNNLDEHLKKLDSIPEDIKSKKAEILKLREAVKNIDNSVKNAAGHDPFSLLGIQNECDILKKKDAQLIEEIEKMREEFKNLPSDIQTKICPNIRNLFKEQTNNVLELERKNSILNMLNKSILLTGLVMIGLPLYKHFY
tara:strand:- start:406 stop:840 length:435 start_codon:yes stop_codon:yes gene_type:complete